MPCLTARNNNGRPRFKANDRPGLRQRERDKTRELPAIGVSGMRGTIGGTLTPAVVTRMASAFAADEGVGRAAGERHAPARRRRPRLARPSGFWVRDAAAAALLASGIEVIDLDVVTTPGVAMMVKHTAADAGVVITASHNLIEWNGMKFLGRAQTALPADAARVKQLYDENRTAYVPVQQLVPPSRYADPVSPPPCRRHARRGELHAADAQQRDARCTKPRARLRRRAGHLQQAIQGRADSVNAPGACPGATLLSKLGCQIIQINGTPNGLFPHEPEPIAKNLTGLSDEVRRQKAAVGFAQDPDADRLAIVDEHGVYIGEEYSLLLAAKAVLSKKPGMVVANLSTSRMIDDIASRPARRPRDPHARRRGERDPGDAGRRVDDRRRGQRRAIDPASCPAATASSRWRTSCNSWRAPGTSISGLVADLPRYEIVKTKFECRREDAERAVMAIKRRFASEKVDTQDGIRIDRAADRTWVHACPSNTEPIMHHRRGPRPMLAEEKIATVPRGGRSARKVTPPRVAGFTTRKN